MSDGPVLGGFDLEILEHAPRPLLWATAAHALAALACLAALRATAPPVLGVHPALKPLKFAVSIAVFLGTMALLLPLLAIDDATRGVLAWVLAITMAVEMLAIGGQALRGETSHFNVRGRRSAATWAAMVLAIVVATAAMGAVALLATVRPMRVDDPLLATAWRAGLWLLLLTPVSGFAMGSRMRHSVGGDDGGPGLPLLNWSVEHGDLRVAHFFALHAVQILPLVAWGLVRGGVPAFIHRPALTGAVALAALACVGALVQALAGRPFASRAGRTSRTPRPAR